MCSSVRHRAETYQGRSALPPPARAGHGGNVNIDAAPRWEGGECPRCGASAFLAVTDGDEVNFVCTECGACLHVELGYVAIVDPFTCPGCDRRHECRDREFVRRLVHAATQEG